MEPIRVPGFEVIPWPEGTTVPAPGFDNGDGTATVPVSLAIGQVEGEDGLTILSSEREIDAPRTEKEE